MTTANQYQRVADLLRAIEQEMRRTGLWEQMAPSPAALASTTPFCYDTLLFPQWLQWVFVARMRAVIDAGAALPTACSIHPLAEHSFAELPQDTTQLLQLIEQIDREITGG